MIDSRHVRGLFLTSLILLTGTVSLSGCAGPKAANKANFARVIEPLLVEFPCRRIPAGIPKSGAPEYPFSFPVLIPFEVGSYSHSDDTAILDPLVTAGLMTVSRVGHDQLDSINPKRTVKIAAYMPVVGQNDVRLIDQKIYGEGIQKLPGFCAGRGKLESIDSWTEPADNRGAQVTTVTYHWKADGMSEKTKLMMRQAGADNPPSTVAHVNLILSNDGWHVG